MIGARKMRLVGGGYLSEALSTNPTYFWPLQGETDLTDVVSGVTLTVDGSAYEEVQSGPFGYDLCWQTTGEVGLYDASNVINANENVGIPFSFGGWFYRNSSGGSGTDAFIGNYGNTMMYGSLTSMYSYVGSASNNHTISPALQYNEWNHFIVTTDGAGVSHSYRNGVLTDTGTAGAPSSVTLFRIGGYGAGTARFRGGTAWCGWWVGKELSLSEIQRLAGV